MNKSRDEIRLLLIQVRSDQFVKNHEHTCFRAASDVQDSQLVSHDLLEQVLPDCILARYDGVLLGGVSDYGAADMFPNRHSLVRLVEEAQRERVPIFAACWGAQFLASLLGGTVEADNRCEKMGTAMIRLTDEASADPVFGKLSKEFVVQAGHNEHITRLPDGGKLLASSSHCPIQAFCIPATGTYGVQFHPELTMVDMEMRLRHRLENGADDQKQLEELLERVEPTPEADTIIGKWIDEVVLKPKL